MNSHHGLRALRILMLTVMLVAGAVAAGPLHIVRSTTNGGGVMHSGDGRFELQGVIGQPVVGGVSGGDFTLTGGFSIQAVSGDCNADGAVGLTDYQPFVTCLTGPDPSGMSSTQCACFDFDASGSVDLRDVSRFQMTFQGGS